ACTCRSSRLSKPAAMAGLLAMMLPALNIDDRADLLGGMQLLAPTDVMDAVWTLNRRWPERLSSHRTNGLSLPAGLIWKDVSVDTTTMSAKASTQAPAFTS